MSSNSTDHLPPLTQGGEYSPPPTHRTDEGMIPSPRDARQTPRRGQEDRTVVLALPATDEGMIPSPRDAHQTPRRGQEDRTVVLALPATNKKREIKEDEKGRKRKRETGSEKREEEEHWSHNFAQELIEMNEGRIPPDDEQITLIPNPLFTYFYS